MRIKLIIAAVSLLVTALLIGWFLWPEKEVEITPEKIESEPIATSTVSVIGKSVEGRPIEVHNFGPESENYILFVGGIHGGYEWNSVLLAYEFIDYLHDNPELIPEDVQIGVVPSANPDGVYEVIKKEGRFAFSDVSETAGAGGVGRFNANGVDLNRNFDCKWQPKSSWRGQEVSAGTAPFSEPEAVAIRDLVLKKKPMAAVFWHSQASAVYASECEGGILPETLTIMDLYADIAGYRAVDSFDAYPVTGDVEGWLASIGVPAITVELSTHTTLEWSKNLPASLSLVEYCSLAK